MSTCISKHGEFGSHEPDADHVCTLCGVHGKSKPFVPEGETRQFIERGERG